MTELTSNGSVCVVLVRENLGAYVFGVYDNEILARKRVKEQDYLIPDGSTVFFENEEVWEELQDYSDDDPDRCPYGGSCNMPGCDCYNDCPRYPHGGDDW